MTQKEFLNNITGSKEDVIQQLLGLLKELKAVYCVIGGLAVNAYVEPVASLDLDIVVAGEAIEKLAMAAKRRFTVKTFPNSLNLKSPRSALRVQIQIDPRYQSFLENARSRTVMGYRMKVASIEDVLRGKIWAYSDTDRRGSKRQKDLADILRLVETHPRLAKLLPASLRPWA